MLKHLCVIVVLVALVGGSAWAQRSPTSVWAEELMGAEVGALLGGAIGLGTVHTACVRFEKSCDPLYRIIVLQERIPREGDLLSVIKLTSPGVHTINMGRGIGALAGVALIGVMRGIEGNIWAAFLATQAWVAASQQIFLLKAPLVPALVATIAYNWGARRKTQTAPAAWGLTLFAARF